MTQDLSELITICIVVRDRFSTTSQCLDTLIANTPQPYELVVIFGGAPPDVRRKLEARYKSQVRFVWKERLLNQAESRNAALRECKTPLLAVVDNDVFVRPGWLPPLIQCLRETNAGFVVPLVLEAPTVVHTAGNDLFVTYKNGAPFAQKVLRDAKIIFYDGCNLKRARTDYGELHCQLIQADVARRLEIFDERLHEQTEVDQGLHVAKGGYEMWFEPLSVVHYDFPERIKHAEDIRSFIFKWNVPLIIRGMAIFKEKWGMDMTEAGTFNKYTAFINQKLGMWSRLFPSRASIAADGFYIHLREMIGSPVWIWRTIKDRIIGSDRWAK